MAKSFEKYAKRGSDNSDRRLRLFDFVVDRKYDDPPLYSGQPALVGYPFDIGVGRNNGRVGAKEGPEALRKALANLAWQGSSMVADLGDIISGQGEIFADSKYFDLKDEVESSQAALYSTVLAAINGGYFPVVLGGGHDLAAATTLAATVFSATENKSCAILNFDAHFDLRRQSRANSGTGFLQAYEINKKMSLDNYHYTAVGIAETSNTQLLFETAASIGAKFLIDRKVDVSGRNFVDDIIKNFDSIYVSVDLDSIELSSMKAVSAPAAYGIALRTIEELLSSLVESHKVIGVDFAEFNPRLDDDSTSSRVAARLIHTILSTQTSGIN
ncbi:MAG: formimidoylglutamase [Actinomycetota bacterium]|nr:formimidoylglutamase [Actinomycetota bacterium]